MIFESEMESKSLNLESTTTFKNPNKIQSSTKKQQISIKQRGSQIKF